MAELKLYKTAWKGLKIIVMCSPFIVAGTWMILSEASGSFPNIMGWLSVCFFGLGVPVGLLSILDRRPQIIVSEKGVWDRTTKQNRINWEQIVDAYILNISGQAFICIASDDTFVPKKRSFGWARNMNKKLGAQNLNLNIGPVNIGAEQLLQLMHELRKADEKDRAKIIRSFRVERPGLVFSRLARVLLYIAISIALLLFSFTGLAAFMAFMLVMGLAAVALRFLNLDNKPQLKKAAELMVWFGLFNMVLFLATAKAHDYLLQSAAQKITLQIEDFQPQHGANQPDFDSVKESADLNLLEAIVADRIQYRATEESYELKTVNLFNKPRTFNPVANSWEKE